MVTKRGPFSLAELAGMVGVPAPAEGGDTLFSDVKPLHEAQGEHLSFLDNAAYKIQAKTTLAGVVLVREAEAEILPETCTPLVVKNPYVAFAQVLQAFYPEEEVSPGISNLAIVSQSATVDPTARLEPGVIVYPNAKIGAGTHVGAYTVVGEGVEIGAHSWVGPQVTLLNTRIGDKCILHSGVRTGQDGFGFAVDGGHLLKIPQVGLVRIGNDVEIGANTTIDRGALGDTVIGEGTKIDCQVQIGHNVRVGRNCRIVAQVGLAGSSTIGDFVVVGGQAGVAGHVAVADGVMIAGKSGVTKSIDQPKAVVAGFPAMPIAQWRRLHALLSRMVKAGSKVRLAKEGERSYQVRQDWEGEPQSAAAQAAASTVTVVTTSVDEQTPAQEAQDDSAKT